MKFLKRLQELERIVGQVHVVKERMEDYYLWLNDHPIPDNDPNLTFEQWLDSIPGHLIPCFQVNIKILFPHLG